MVSPGDIVGSYRIQGRARTGEGWWCVRRAGSEDLGELLAWEPGDLGGDQAAAAVDTLNRIQSPAVPSVLERFEQLWVLDATPGLPLTEVLGAIQGGAVLQPPEVLAITLEVGRALLAGHHKGRYHGHLHPGLVWLTPDGAVHVWGHGLKGARPPADWLAPERARNKSVAGATDQWSLGALACALLSGHAPWQSDAPQSEAEVGVATLMLSPVAEHWPDLGRWARRVLEAEPRLRYPSLHPALDGLEALQRKTAGYADLQAMLTRLEQANTPPAEVPAEHAEADDERSAELTEEAPEQDEVEAAAEEDELVTVPAAPQRLSEPVPHEPMAVVRPSLSDPDVVPEVLGPEDEPEQADSDPVTETPTHRRAKPPELMRPPPDSDPDSDAESNPDEEPSGPAPAITIPTPSLVPDTSELMQDPASVVDDPLDAPAKRDGKPMRTIVPRQVGGAATIIPTDSGTPAPATEVEYITDPGPGQLTDPDGFFDGSTPPSAVAVELDEPEDVLPSEPVGDPPAPLPGAEPHPVVRYVPWIIAAMLLLMALSLALS